MTRQKRLEVEWKQI